MIVLERITTIALWDVNENRECNAIYRLTFISVSLCLKTNKKENAPFAISKYAY
jgi:hypothetical protein